MSPVAITDTQAPPQPAGAPPPPPPSSASEFCKAAFCGVSRFAKLVPDYSPTHVSLQRLLFLVLLKAKRPRLSGWVSPS